MSWWKNPKRSKFGKWLDKKGITQAEFSESSKVSRATVSTMCNEKSYSPSPKVLKKVMDQVKKIDRSKEADDFFSL
ncbi:helix-turn-helix transcriptional regulator [Priestia aryabhattai]|uniref:helix-turn-helix domain-containing protein n=1 Tax=Priestia aryabhattai TaxID=412384 RepID=UPI000649B725|nr:helix-turn-helix transcriptional regulator [Priestia aryabhattai]MDT0150182.1 helix-turn-helix transcriptional regulator [Priestia aryabhattai]MDT0155748.1 helix-turn-helix transcriptional regulator [Priestia aryabhattai]